MYLPGKRYYMDKRGTGMCLQKRHYAQKYFTNFGKALRQS